MIRCRFCGDPAVARYAMSDGCFCFPDDREQDLCLQREDKASPLGSMTLLDDYTVLEVPNSLVVLRGGPWDGHIVEGSGRVPVIMLGRPRLPTLWDPRGAVADWSESRQWYERDAASGGTPQP